AKVAMASGNLAHVVVTDFHQGLSGFGIFFSKFRPIYEREQPCSRLIRVLRCVVVIPEMALECFLIKPCVGKCLRLIEDLRGVWFLAWFDFGGPRFDRRYKTVA